MVEVRVGRRGGVKFTKNITIGDSKRWSLFALQGSFINGAFRYKIDWAFGWDNTKVIKRWSRFLSELKSWFHCCSFWDVKSSSGLLSVTQRRRGSMPLSTLRDTRPGLRKRRPFQCFAPLFSPLLSYNLHTLCLISLGLNIICLEKRVQHITDKTQNLFKSTNLTNFINISGSFVLNQ